MDKRRCKPTVLLLYNLSPDWKKRERVEVERETRRFAEAVQETGFSIIPIPIVSPDFKKVLLAYDPMDYIVFNWCEEVPGLPNGEVHVAQSLESAGFTYTGSPPQVLELCQHKLRVKEILKAHHLPTPDGLLIQTWEEIAGWSRFPAIVKAAAEHCSLGLSPKSVVTNRDELVEQVAWIHQTLHQPALVEEFIDGREFHIALIGNGTLQMLPPAEMDFGGFSDLRERLCTYEAKFDPESRHYQQIQTRLPAPLSEAEQAALESVCHAAYRAIGCRDYARLDLRLQNGIFYILDVNPNADISSEASIACAAEVIGWSYGELGRRLIELAIHRHPAFAAA
jgi:D-alanine-D-alanine ligase